MHGDVVNIKDTAGTAGNEYYWYDSVGRITKAMANSTFGTIMYGYYPNGDRRWKNEGTNITYTYGTYSKLSSDGTYSYAYDADGNVIWKNQSSPSVQIRYLYNSFGQMTQVDRYVSGVYSATLARYYYDANGARAKTEESGTIYRYIYSGHDPMYYNSTDGKGYKDVYLGGRQELRIVSPTEKWAYVADALGSTRKVLQNGRPGSATFSAVTYKPFGPVVTTTGSDKFTYAGEMQDSPTGLVYLFARYYDPELGRFYALDPELGKVSRPQTLDRYVYCANGPLINTDPTGRIVHIIAGILIGAAIGGLLAYYTHQNVLAGIAGGAIAGGIISASFGAATPLVAGSAALNGACVGGLAGGVGGMVQGGLQAGIDSDGDPRKTIEGIYTGGITGTITGVLSGAISGGILGEAITRFGEVPVKPYSAGVNKLTNVFRNAKNAAYTPEGGIVEGDALMRPGTAASLARVTTSSLLVSYGRAFSIPVGLKVREFTKSMYE